MELTYIPKNITTQTSFKDILLSLKDSATRNGVFADFFRCEDTDESISGTYFVVCADSEPLIDLKRNPEQLRPIIKFNNKLETNMINPHFSTVKIPEITLENYFSIHNQMCQAIHNVAVVRHAFYQYGYKIPKLINQSAVNDIFSFYVKGHNNEMPEHLQEIYRESYKKFVSEMNQIYNKKYFKNLKKKVIKKHRVSADYFRDNLISTVYVSAPEPFFKYLEEHLDECPNFVYCKESKPYLHVKDISHLYKGPAQWNYWKDFTEVKRYNMGYPLEYHEFFNKMAIEFCYQEYEQKISEEDLKKMTKEPLLHLNVRKEDMRHFNTVCEINNVKYAFDHGHYKSSDGKLMLDPILLYRKEDHDAIHSIIARMTQEKRGNVSTDPTQKKAVEKNRPKNAENPFTYEL